MIHLPKPCRENWTKMTPVEGGRHCGSCDKVITDFTDKTEYEILMAITSPNRVCGHFRSDQVTDGQTYGGWQHYFKWKSAVAVLIAGSLFLAACHKKAYRTGGMPNRPKHSDSCGHVHTKWLLDTKVNEP